MSFIASLIDSLFPKQYRYGTMECPCGAIQCELKVPPSSHLLIEQANVLCHCDDCMNYCQACPNGEYVVENYANHYVHFYKSDITVVKGQEKIKAVKLTDSTMNIRLYCGDCGTPLGSGVTAAPFNMIHRKLITKGPTFLPSMVLGRKWAPAEARPYAGVGVVTREGVFGFWFLLRVMGRVFLGFLLGKNHGGMVPGGPESYSSIPVGFDKIEAAAEDKKKNR
jgi:hypothetical protein